MGYLGATTSGIRTPSFVLAELRTVNNFIRALARDIGNTEVPQAFKQEFVAFVEEWDEFYKENTSGIFGGWLSRAMNSVYDKTQEYRAMALQWRDRFVREGGTPATPKLPESAGRSIWPFVLGGGIVLGAVYLVFGGRK